MNRQNKFSAKSIAKFARQNGVTLLCVGTMSKEVVRSAMEVGKSKNFPVFLIASRNQVDSDCLGGGYANNWNQQRLADDIESLIRDLRFDGDVHLCRDHGGQWQKDSERLDLLPFFEARERAFKSYREDLQHGFSVIHVDPILNPHRDVSLYEVSELVEDTIAFIEHERLRLQLPPVDYEIGSERNVGVAIKADRFEDYALTVMSKLLKRNLPMPAFLVGQTGSLVEAGENVGRFDKSATRDLVSVCDRLDVYFKGHNTDYLSRRDLSFHPIVGVAAANVAPEFSLIETQELLKLAKQLNFPEFSSTLDKLVFDSRVWNKWLSKRQSDLEKDSVKRNQATRRRIVELNAHYHFGEPVMVELRHELFKTAQHNGIHSPEELIREAIKSAIEKYTNAFRLCGFNTLLEAQCFT